MRNLRLRNTLFRLLFLAGFAGVPLTLALGHEGHHVKCNGTTINAVKADIQARARQKRQPPTNCKRREI